MVLINQVRNPKGQDVAFIGVSINGQTVDIEIDTGGNSHARRQCRGQATANTEEAMICNWTVVRTGR